MSEADTPAAVETPSAPEPVDLNATVEVPPIPETPVEEFEDFEWEGGKYKVTKGASEKFRSGLMAQKDYTQKTTAVAEQRKQLEQAAQQIAQRDEVARRHIQAVGAMMNIDARLQELAKTNWQQLEAEDPFKAQSLTREYTLLRDQRNAIAYQVQQREQQRSIEQQQQVAQRQRDFVSAYERTNAQLAVEIPNWNQELANNLRGYAQELGLNEQQIGQWAVSVPAVKMLHQAYVGRQLQELRKQAADIAEPKVQPAPLKTVSGAGSKPAVNLADADMETYVATRKKQIAARQR